MEKNFKKNSQARFDYKPYLFTTAFTMIIIFSLIIILDLYPFGDKTLMYLDGDQYFGFYGYLVNALTSNDNLFYSWGNVLGNEMISTYGYYAASPLNFILVFFKNNLILGIHFVTYLKLILIANAFCYFLNYKNQNNHIVEKALISTVYAFIGYTIFYLWNGSWLDGVLILPLIAVGLKKLLYDNKRALYVLSLAFICFSNYYIAFMICIISFIFYLFHCAYYDSKKYFSVERLVQTFPNYIISSVLGAGISAALLIPVFLNLPERQLNLWDLIANFKYNFKMLDIFSMFYTGSLRIYESSSNLPSIFIGIIPFFFVIMYFINHKVSFRDKIMSGAFLLVIYFSFLLSPLNMFWHGLTENVWFNYRYSFIFSFILLIIAYKTLILDIEIKEVLESILIFLLITSMVYSVETPHFAPKLNSFDIFLCFLVVLIFVNFKLYPFSLKYGKILLSTLILFNMGLNGYIVLRDAIPNTSASKYFEDKEVLDAVNASISDDSVTRIGKDNIFGRCEPSMFGYAGITNFASTENPTTLKLVKDLGLYQYWMMSEYESNKMLSTQNLLGINYIVTDKELERELYDYKDRINNYNIYKNNYALPLMFKSDGLLVENNTNLFELQNDIFKSLYNNANDIFTPSNFEIAYEDVPIITIYGQGKKEFIQYVDYLPSFEIIRGDGSTYINEEETKSSIYNLGFIPVGENLKIKLYTNDFIESNLKIYNENTNNILDICKHIIKNTTFTVKKISSSHLSTVIDYNEESLICTTIPYDENWNVYQDGKRIDITENMGGLISFKVDEGKHDIELKYTPKGAKLGIIISLLSTCLFIVLNVIQIKKAKL